MGRFQATAHEIELAHIDIEAVDLRTAGWSYEMIAAHQGCTAQTASNRVRRALARWYKHDTEETRTLEMERLDQVTKRLMEIVTQQTGVMREYLTDDDGAIMFDADGNPRQRVVHDEDGNTIPVHSRSDDDRAIRAIEKFVAVSARRAALLGLDQPKRIAQEVHVDVEGNITHEHEVTITVLQAFQEYADVLGAIVEEEASGRRAIGPVTEVVAAKAREAEEREDEAEAAEVVHAEVS
jgi:hypothetical protein